MKNISDLLKDILLQLERENKKDTMNMRRTKGKPRVVDLTGNDFLKQRGLRMDKANFVTLLIRMRADLEALGRLASDEDVEEEIETLVGFISETVELMYLLEEVDDNDLAG